jgi:hypothetical protein
MMYSSEELSLKLGPRASRGSKPRCHILMDGARKDVATRLNELATPYALVSEADRWMPQGFLDVAEPELDKASVLLDQETRAALKNWWLPADYPRARTPNFDIASTCTIENRKGILLVEAKAHWNELRGESGPRRATPRKGRAESEVEDSPEYRETSAITIGRAIEEARAGFSRDTELRFGIGRDTCYQMSNRFAWSWKLTERGIPVVLVYLGFLNAVEMNDISPAFSDAGDWEREVLSHSKAIVPGEAWERRFMVNGSAFAALIRSSRQTL